MLEKKIIGWIDCNGNFQANCEASTEIPVFEEENCDKISEENWFNSHSNVETDECGNTGFWTVDGNWQSC